MSYPPGFAETAVMDWAECEWCRSEFENVEVVLHNGWAEFECPHCGGDSEIHDLDEEDR